MIRARTLALTAVSLVTMLASAACDRWIEGRVTDWATGDPVTNAQVALMQSDCEWDVFIIIPIQDCEWRVLETTTTDGEGAFRLDSVPGNESLALDVSKPGYMSVFEAVDPKGLGPTKIDISLMPEPPAPVEALALGNRPEGIEIAWTEPESGNYEGTLIVRFEGEDYPGESPPEHGVQYRPGDAIGSAAVVFAGSGGLFLDSDVSEGGHYWYQAFAFSPVTVYSDGSPLTGTVYDCTPPPPVSDAAAFPDSLWVVVSWVAPAGADGVLVVRSLDNPLDAAPEQGEAYDREQEIGNGVVAFVARAEPEGGPEEIWDSDAPESGHLFYTLFAFDEYHNYSEGVSIELIIAVQAFGEACTQNYECRNEGYIFDEPWCADSRCSRTCEHDTACPDGTTCAEIEPGIFACRWP